MDLMLLFGSEMFVDPWSERFFLDNISSKDS
jgi:hypothetical protein